jgi:hypothetical protein
VKRKNHEIDRMHENVGRVAGFPFEYFVDSSVLLS